MAIPAAPVFPTSTRAKTTPYPENNCGLNGLVHVLVPNMGDVSAEAPGRQELLDAFNAYYGVYVRNWDQLTHILQDIQNPVHREIVLGPVLRQLTTDPTLRTAQPNIGWKPLAADEVAAVANKFEIKVEGYATPTVIKQVLKERLRENPALQNNPVRLEQETTAAFNQILANPNHPDYPNKDQFRPEASAAIVQPADPIATLKLWNVGGHWEYEESNAAETQKHNLAYKGQHSLYTTDAQQDALCQKIANTIMTTPLGNTPDLNKVFSEFELDNRAKQSPIEGLMGPLQKVTEQLPNIMNPLGIGGKNNFFVFIGQLLTQLINAFISIFPVFQELMKAFRQIGKTVDSPLDQDDINRDPRIAKKAAEFAKLSNALANTEEGKEKANEFNREWRQHPNNPELWEKLIVALVNNGQLDTADAWLRAQEKRLLEELNAVESKLSVEEQQPRPRNVNAAPDRTRLRQAFTTYRDGLQMFENPVLSYATPQEQQDNFIVRLKMFQKCSDALSKIKDKHTEELKTVEKLKEMKALKHSIKQDVRAAQQANQNSAITNSLQQRLDKVQEEFDELKQRLNNMRGDTTHEDHLLSPAVKGAVDYIVTTYSPDFNRVAQAAEQNARAAARQARASHRPHPTQGHRPRARAH